MKVHEEADRSTEDNLTVGLGEPNTSRSDKILINRVSQEVALNLLEQSGFASDSRKRGHLERQELNELIKEVAREQNGLICLKDLFFALCEIQQFTYFSPSNKILKKQYYSLLKNRRAFLQRLKR